MADVRLEVTSADAELVRCVNARLWPLQSRADSSPDIVFELSTRRDSNFSLDLPIGPRRRVYDAPCGGIDYHEDGDILSADYADAVQLRCAASSGHVTIAIAPGDAARALATYPFFTISLMETAKRRGLYPLHAACVAHDGRGLLLAGSSGAGKTTLTLELLDRGLTFLSDDLVFLERRSAGLHVVALPDEVDVTDDTIDMFTWLEPLRDAPVPIGRPKRSARVERLIPVDTDLDCAPAALVLIERRAGQRPELERVSKATALAALAANVMLTEPKASQAHLSALGALVRGAPCYMLRSGADVHVTADALLRVFG